jgi:hypothetical protein
MWGLIHMEMKHGYDEPDGKDCIQRVFSDYRETRPGKGSDSVVYIIDGITSWGVATKANVVVGYNILEDGNIAGVITTYTYPANSQGEVDNLSDYWECAYGSRDW